MKKTEYYSSKRIREYGAKYNIIIGERSNGKTYDTELHALEDYFHTGGVGVGSQTALVRRWADDFTGKRGSSMFDALVKDGHVERLSGGEWTGIYYYSSRWFLCRWDPDTGKRISADDPFAYGFAVTSEQHDKSTSYPRIKTIIFDEFISRTGYIPDEFVLFCSVLSTIIRDRNDVTVWMLGNTISKFCPYFREMGLSHVKDMKPGDIDIYHYGQTDLTVAVEYTPTSKHGKASDVYFAFDNPKLQMITGGAWEMAIYPHCPEKYAPKDVKFTYFIIFDGDTLQCEIVQRERNIFTFIHRKTSELRRPDTDLIYSADYDPRPNWRRKITVPATPAEEKILWFFRTEKVFYQDNEVGEIVRNYIMWCKKSA